MSTKIQWTDETWNPVVGCSKVSEGCQNCYAERMAARLWRMGRGDYGSVLGIEDYKWNGKILCRESFLDKPLHWKKPRRIFVCSMSDLFHPSVPFEFRGKVFDIIQECPQHTFQILTKRPEIAYDFFGGTSGMGLSAPPLKNLWLGVTAENQRCADERIPILLQIPAAVRFVSFEPILEHILIPLEKLEGIDWAIFGCESLNGKVGRFCEDEEDFCRAVRNPAHQIKYGLKKPIFIKQLPINGKVSRKMSEWPEDLRVREYPNARH